MRRRILSFILCIVLLLTVIPSSVFATGEDVTVQIGLDGETYSVAAENSILIPVQANDFDPEEGYPVDTVQFNIDYDSDAFELEYVTTVHNDTLGMDLPIYIGNPSVQTGNNGIALAGSGWSLMNNSNLEVYNYICFLKLTANSTAESGTYTISFKDPEGLTKRTAYNNVVYNTEWVSCDVEVDGVDPTIKSIAITDGDGESVASVAVKGNLDANNHTYTIKAISTSEKDITSLVDWSCTYGGNVAEKVSVSVDDTTGVGTLTIDKEAPAGDYKILATPIEGKSQCAGDAENVSTTITVVHDSVPQEVYLVDENSNKIGVKDLVSNPDPFLLFVDPAECAQYIFMVKAKDQFGDELDWSEYTEYQIINFNGETVEEDSNSNESSIQFDGYGIFTVTYPEGFDPTNVPAEGDGTQIYFEVAPTLDIANYYAFAFKSTFLTVEWDDYVEAVEDKSYGTKNSELVTKVSGKNWESVEATAGEVSCTGKITVDNPDEIQIPDSTTGKVTVGLTFTVTEEGSFKEKVVHTTIDVPVNSVELSLSATVDDYAYGTVFSPVLSTSNNLVGSDVLWKVLGCTSEQTPQDVLNARYVVKKDNVPASLNDYEQYDVGTYTIEMDAEIAENYKRAYKLVLANPDSFTVSKGTISPAPAGTTSIYYGNHNPMSITVDNLTAWTGWDGEPFTSIESVILKSGSGDKFIVDGTNKTLTLGASAQEGDTATITVTCGSKNYNDVNVDITIDLVDKKDVSGDIEITGNSEFTYDSYISFVYNFKEDATYKPDDGVGTWEITYEGIDGTSYGPKADVPVDVGKYQMICTYEDDVVATDAPYGHIGTQTFNFEIKKRDVEFHWSYKVDGDSMWYVYAMNVPDPAKLVYCGKQYTVKPALDATFATKYKWVELPDLTSGYSATDAGEYTTSEVGNLTGPKAGNFKYADGALKALTWKIWKADLTEADIKDYVQLNETALASLGDVVFSGEAVEPSVTEAGETWLAEVAKKAGDDDVQFEFSYKYQDGETWKDFTGTPITVGTYKLCAKVTGAKNYNDNVVELQEFKITPKEITPAIDDTNVEDHIWDSTTDVDGTPAITFSDIPSGYEPYVTATWAWATSAVGEHTLVASNIELADNPDTTGTDESVVNQNYTLSVNTVSKEATKGIIKATYSRTAPSLTLNIYYKNTDTFYVFASDFDFDLEEGLELQNPKIGIGEAEWPAGVEPTISLEGRGFSDDGWHAKLPTISDDEIKEGAQHDYAYVTITSDNYEDISPVEIHVVAVDVQFEVDGDPATDTNAFSKAENPTYGAKWSEIITKVDGYKAIVDTNYNDNQEDFVLYVKKEGDASPTPYNGANVPGAGTYIVTLVFSGIINEVQYKSTVASKEITIAKAPVTKDLFNITPSLPLTTTYDGEKHGIAVNAKEGIVGLGNITVKYVGTDDTIYDESETAPTNAGKYSVNLYVTAGDNYKATAPAIELGTITINKASSTMATAPTAKTGLVYDNSSQVLITEGTSDCGTVWYKINDGSATPDVNSVVATNAGTYTISYGITGNANHSDWESKTPLTVTIAKADVGFSGNLDIVPITYGQPLSAAVFSGDYSIGRLKDEGGGSYSIDGSIEGTITWKNPNYVPTVAQGEAGFIIVVAPSESYSANYKSTEYNSGPLIVGKAPIIGLTVNETYLYTAKFSELTTTAIAKGQYPGDAGEDVNVDWYTDENATTPINLEDAMGTSVGTLTLYAKITDDSADNHEINKDTVYPVEITLTQQQTRPDTPSAKKTIFANSTENGKFSISNSKAKKNQKVIITVTPDPGYVVSSITVVDKNGEYLDVDTITENSKYSFVANGLKTYVTVEFELAEKDNPFIDINANKYYYDAVLWAYENDITSGLTAYTFGPNAACSRAQVVTFLWRAAGCPSPSLSTCAFTDVESGSYYEQAVLWAVEKGITTGTSATTFSPDDTVTRSQVVTFLYRTVGAKTVATSLAFGDVDPDKYYADAVAWAVEKGITTGTSATTFSPDDDCTRGQIVTFLYRFFGLDK